MKDNQMFQNRKRPRRYKGRPGVSSGPNASDSTDMDPNTEESSGELPMEVVQEIAEAVMAEQAADAQASEHAAPANDLPLTESTSNRPPRDAQGPPVNRREQEQQQRREQEQQRREQEAQRRQQEQQRREQERLRREDENRRREQDRQRREAEDRARMPIDDLCRKAWDIYLAEVSEEGVELFPDNDARELARRSFRLAEIFLQEELRARRPPPPPPPVREPREPRESRGAGSGEGSEQAGSEAVAPEAVSSEEAAPAGEGSPE